jgi:hypothetical protein
MHGLIKKIHIYLGLLNFLFVLIFGITGIVAALRYGPYRMPNPQMPPRYWPYAAPAGFTDKQVADDVYRELNLPLTSLPESWAIKRDDDGNLLINLYTINGPYRATLLEKENRLRVERIRENIWLYIDNLHAYSISEPGHDRLLRMWAHYNELAIWSLLSMVLSGIYLGLTSRPNDRLPRYSLASGLAVFLVLYLLMRQ